MKKQIVFIHGGETFNKYEEYIKYLKNAEFNPRGNKEKKWKDSLGEELGSDFEVIMPRMPSKDNAKYKEWKIWFEKTLPYLKNNAVFIGHSLGGIFLAKYLSENRVPKKIRATYLIAAPYNDKNSKNPLSDFVLPKSLKKFERQSGKIFVYHSRDDQMVPFDALNKYTKAIPSAEKVTFKNKGHFPQKNFPELIGSIKRLY